MTRCLLRIDMHLDKSVRTTANKRREYVMMKQVEEEHNVNKQ